VWVAWPFGFAFKGFVSRNFLQGLLLLIREPFSVEDYIECEGFEGQVEEITIRDTHVRARPTDQLFVAPNAMFFKESRSHSAPPRRAPDHRDCGVAYGEDVDAAREV